MGTNISPSPTEPEPQMADTGNTPTDFVKDVAILFLAAIAIVVGMLLITYLFVIVMDRYCCCVPDLRRPGETVEVDHGSVARTAGLWGLRPEERQSILERILQGKPYTAGMMHGDEENPIEKNTTEETSLTKDGDTGSPGDIMANDKETKQEEKSEGSIDLDEGSYDRTCSICLAEYVDGETVVTGTSCNHLFHKSCAFSWLLEHDHCPYCRKEMMTAGEMREAATELFGQDRVLEMLMWGPTQELMRNNLGQDDSGPVRNEHVNTSTTGSMMELSRTPHGVHSA